MIFILIGVSVSTDGIDGTGGIIGTRIMDTLGTALLLSAGVSILTGDTDHIVTGHTIGGIVPMVVEDSMGEELFMEEAFLDHAEQEDLGLTHTIDGEEHQ